MIDLVARGFDNTTAKKEDDLCFLSDTVKSYDKYKSKGNIENILSRYNHNKIVYKSLKLGPTLTRLESRSDNHN
jgi:hypothetical protein